MIVVIKDVEGWLLEGVGAPEIWMVGRRLGDLVFGVRAFFLFIQVVAKDVVHHHVSGFLGAQRSLASALQAFVAKLFSQTE